MLAYRGLRDRVAAHAASLLPFRTAGQFGHHVADRLADGLRKPWPGVEHGAQVVGDGVFGAPNRIASATRSAIRSVNWRFSLGNGGFMG